MILKKLYNVPKVNYRSITCQTDERISETSNKETYFFCNLNYHDGMSTAEVQMNIAVNKTVDKVCDANLPILKTNVQDFDCNPIDQDSTKLYYPGFHGITSINSDEDLNSLTSVTFSIFSFLLNILPDIESSKINKRTKLLINFNETKNGTKLFSVDCIIQHPSNFCATNVCNNFTVFESLAEKIYILTFENNC